MPDLSSNLIAWERRGFDRDYLRFLFPALPTCEFSSVPMHGCECNGCLMGRLEELA